MGSCSRYEACEAFIKEFEKDYLACNNACGYNSTIIAERLGFNDLYECVFHYMTIDNGAGGEFEVMSTVPIFDPECDADDDKENIAELLDKSEDEIRVRFGKAGLL